MTDTNDIRKPLPCPFCGSTEVGDALGEVFCYSCPARIRLENANTDYAVELWNQRQSQQAQGEPVAWAAFTADGNIRIWSEHETKAHELAAAVNQELLPLYLHPAPTALPEGWGVGNLVTLNRDKYPGLGEWFTQIWCGDDVVARIYGKDHEQIRERIAAMLTDSPAPDHIADVRKMVAPDVSELEKAAQKLWRESYSCESDFIQAVVDAFSKQEEEEPVVQQHYPCGCVTCICEDDVQCQGCGGTSCDDFKGPSCGCTHLKEEAER